MDGTIKYLIKEIQYKNFDSNAKYIFELTPIYNLMYTHFTFLSYLSTVEENANI